MPRFMVASLVGFWGSWWWRRLLNCHDNIRVWLCCSRLSSHTNEI